MNRRQSDLTDKTDGVLYTSDGRDVEMSVASTKAFYAQIAAGCLLAVALAEAAGGAVDVELLAALRDLPDAMTATIERRADIARAAHTLGPPNRYWAIVGNGVNRIAAEEIRIKLSELCYKSISCDATEDKKHIDLSCEPMILVCAAGLTGSTADDVAKEVAIYRAHKATPIVIATDGEARFSAAMHAISVPPTHPRLAFVLSTMAGHLFGYEAALAIDAQAQPLREARAAIEAAAGNGAASGEVLLRSLRPAFDSLAAQVLRRAAHRRVRRPSRGEHRGTALRAAALHARHRPAGHLRARRGQGRHACGSPRRRHRRADARHRGADPSDRRDQAPGEDGDRGHLADRRGAAARAARPGDAGAGAPRDSLSYRTLRTLADLDPAIAEVTGYTRYRIDGSIDDEDATITVVDKGGIAVDLPSRAERSPALRGTKHRVAGDRDVLVATGRRDNRPIVIVPEVKDNQPTGITLLHVRFADRLSVSAARGVLQGYRHRYALLRDAVTETEPTFREDLLADIPVIDLLVQAISDLADRWRADR